MSFLKASVTPRIGSGGPPWTCAHVDPARDATTDDLAMAPFRRRMLRAEEEVLAVAAEVEDEATRAARAARRLAAAIMLGEE